MKEKKKASRQSVMIISITFFIIVLVLILLSLSNYPVQWRRQVDAERLRYLGVFSQALEYYYFDHERVLPELPDRPSIISNSAQCKFLCRSLDETLPCFNMQDILVPNYMKEILQDPMVTSDSDSGFYLYQRDKEVVIGACNNYYGKASEVIFGP